MRVLVTGAAGSIGRVVCAGLLDRGYDVAALDLTPEPEGFTGPWYTVDCADPDAVDAVFSALLQGGPLDGVVHLASIPTEASLPVILESHVVTTAALLDAMVTHGVTRIVYASSNHAVGRTPRDQPVDTSTPPRPDTFYGTGKVAAEALLRLYAERHSLDAFAARIGSFLLEPETRRHLSTWLSHDDAVRMVHACLTAPDAGFAVLYGISANTRAWWDLEAGRRLGYEPQDDAESFAAAIEARPETADDRADAAFVGGPFVGESYYRPALDRG